tara:strand:+ start:1557 stop:1796 length:240 start_codon:yes stop_codon:yes gene_type:complete
MPDYDFDDMLETLEDEEQRQPWEDEWMCPSCEHGPMDADSTKCGRCGCKKDQKFKLFGDDDDGWGEETDEVEEINYDYY